jgi:SAM-dependent methyltransferase
MRNGYLNIVQEEKFNIKKILHLFNAYNKIKSLNLFDEEFYLKNNPDLTMNPLIHYIYYGYKDNKQPSESFDGVFYLNDNPHVKKAGLNPLVHYALYGKNEGKATLYRKPARVQGEVVKKYDGHCIICDKGTGFEARNTDLREYLYCNYCRSNSRQRILFYTLNKFYPNWKDLNIYEASSGPVRLTKRLKECKNYISSQYYPYKKFGEKYNGFYNINLEKKHFQKEQFDIVITQDVFEHLYEPKKALKYMYRTLKPGGAHICTFPRIKDKPTEKCSIMKQGKIIWLKEKNIHGSESPVSFYWGQDTIELIEKWSKFKCEIITIDNPQLGLIKNTNEAIIMRKLKHN